VLYGPKGEGQRVRGSNLSSCGRVFTSEGTLGKQVAVGLTSRVLHTAEPRPEQEASVTQRHF
jgi:hypothetical protein